MARFHVKVPDSLEAGAYANALAVWHTPYEFTLDFGVMLPSQPDPNGNPVIPIRVVSRVKVPPTRLADFIDALTKNLQNYEAQFGPAPKPTPGQLRIEIPDDISSLFPEEADDGEDE